MYNYTVTWYINGAKISVPVILDRDMIADMALESLDGRLVDIIDEATPYVEQV